MLKKWFLSNNKIETVTNYLLINYMEGIENENKKF